MALKFCSTPQVFYGKQPGRNDDWRERFPPKAQPIATASQTGGPPLYTFTADGQQHLAHYRSGEWRKLDNVVVDARDGTRALRETGETINPVMWEPQGK